MKRYYPLAYLNGKKDPFNTMSTYDSCFTVDECYSIIRTWKSMNLNITECYIQEYDGNNQTNYIKHSVPENIWK